jgi:hypothetical protein
MNKEEKRKMKTLELNSKEDFQYYLYQLICRGGGRFLGPELSNSKTASILHRTQIP